MLAGVLINLLGFAATASAVAVFVPQAARTWRLRNNHEALEGVSLASQVALLANAALWIVYAVATQAYWSGVPSLFYIPLAVFVIVLPRRARRAPGPAPVIEAGPRCSTCGDTGVERAPGGGQPCVCTRPATPPV